MIKILLVEDEEHILENLRINLELDGYQVVTSSNGKDAYEIAKSGNFNLLILDIMLPELDGLNLFRKIKAVKPNLPAIFLTAKAGGKDRVEGLKSGAEDYISKPFELEEFLLRVKNVLKRYQTTNENQHIFKLEGFEINFNSFEITRPDGKVHLLTARENNLLRLLVSKKNTVVSRDEILENVWSADENPSSRTIDNIILSFRKIFNDDPKKPRFFHSVRGIGYKFTPGN